MVFCVFPVVLALAAMLVPVGFSVMLQMGSSNTLIQSMVPDQLRGRVMSVYSMMFMGMAPIGSLLAGAAADRIGAPWTVAFGGVVCTIAAVIFWLRLPLIRGHARRLIAAQQLAGDPPHPISDEAWNSNLPGNRGGTEALRNRLHWNQIRLSVLQRRAQLAAQDLAHQVERGRRQGHAPTVLDAQHAAGIEVEGHQLVGATRTRRSRRGCGR